MEKIIISFFIILSTISANASETASTIFNKYSSSVVYIETKFGMGTGFLVSNNVIVTNRHVVFGLNVEKNSWNAPQKIWLNKGKELAAFNYMVCSMRVDICILGVNSNYKLSKKSNLTSNSVTPGEDVYIIGHPSGISVPIISTGIISSEINNFVWEDIRGEKATFQGFTSTAAISSGSSGSPVMSKKGEILGIAVGYYKEAQNLNFIISTSEINLLIKNVYDKKNKEFAYLKNGFDIEFEQNTKMIKPAIKNSGIDIKPNSNSYSMARAVLK